MIALIFVDNTNYLPSRGSLDASRANTSLNLRCTSDKPFNRLHFQCAGPALLVLASILCALSALHSWLHEVRIRTFGNTDGHKTKNMGHKRVVDTNVNYGIKFNQACPDVVAEFGNYRGRRLPRQKDNKKADRRCGAGI